MSRVILNAGDFHTIITLLTPTLSTDAGGAKKATYAAFSSVPNVWAKIVFAHGTESMTNGAGAKSIQRVTVTIRYRSDVDATKAITLNSETWKIIGTPDNIQNRNQYLEFQAELVKGTV